MFSKTTVLSLTALALTQQAMGALFLTNPVATTVGSGGQPLTVSWNDDGKSPTLQQIGACNFGLYAGNAQQQTLLQLINPGLDVSTAAQVVFTVNPQDGPNFDQYFIKVISNGLPDPANPAAPYESFSAKFTLNSMTGTFNATVQAEISGSAPAAGAPPPSTPAASSSAPPNPANQNAPTSSASKPASTAPSKSSTGTAQAPKNTGNSASTTFSSSIGLSVMGVAMAALALVV